MSFEREKVLQAAEKLVEKQRFDKAIVEYQKIVEYDPTDARTLLKIGDLQTRIEAYEDALATYEQVARYYSSQGMSLKAIAVYKQIRELIRKHVPDMAARYGHILPVMGGLYQDLGLPGDALAAFDEYAARLHAAGRDQEAIEVFRKIVELNGNHPLTRLRFAEALIRQNRTEEALREFYAASEILVGLGHLDDALKVLERMLFQKPDARYARRAAELYLQRGHAEDGMLALAKLQICFQADTRNLATLQLLAQTFDVLDQGSKAIEVRKEIARIARDKGEFLLAKQTAEALLADAGNDEAVRSVALSILAADQASIRPGHIDSTAPATIAPASRVLDTAPPETIVAESITVDSLTPESHLSSQEQASTDVTVEVSMQSSPPGNFGDRPSSTRSPPSEHRETAYQSLIRQVQTQRSNGAYREAIDLLQSWIATNGPSIDVLTLLKSVLLEIGDVSSACEQLLTIASMHLDALDATTSAQVLMELLKLQPDHQAARAMLTGLGYEPPPVPLNLRRQSKGSLHEIAPAQQTSPGHVGQGPVDVGRPMPSYDLEEVSPQDAMSSVPKPSTEVSALLEPNAPFSVTARETQSHSEVSPRAPQVPGIPSFPLLESPESSRTVSASVTATEASAAQTASAPITKPQAQDAPVRPSTPKASQRPFGLSPSLLAGQNSSQSTLFMLANTQAFRGGDSLEAALDEAEFFFSRALYEDAMSILQEQLARHPNNPVLLERIQLVTAAMPAPSELVQTPSLGPQPPIETLEDDPVYRLGTDLDQVNAGVADAFVGVTKQYTGGVDVENVFAQFKEGVRAQISDADSQAHFDLGVAYNEMGLWNDAIEQFMLTAKDPRRECVSWSMIGLVRRQLGDLDGAMEAFITGLNATTKTAEQELGLYYELGSVYEQRSSAQEALYYFEKVLSRDPGFRDVEARIQALRTHNKVLAVPPTDMDDDFERAFDNLFDDK